MTKTKLSTMFDSFFISTTLSFILYLWINRYLKNAKISLFICIIAYILMFFTIFKKENSKYNLNKLKFQDQKLANLQLSFLIYSSDKINNDYFCKLLNCTHITNNIFENKQTYFYINLKTELNDFDFHFANNFYETTLKSKSLVFIYNKINDSFKNLILNAPTKFEIFDFNNLFLFMKEKQLYPSSINIKNSRLKKLKLFKEKTLSSLTKKHFFKFFFSGISLLFISIFIPFSFYYMIFGTILLIFAIACLFCKHSPLKNNSSLKNFIDK